MKFVLLNGKLHDRRKFCCEEDSLTTYIQQQANQDIKKNLAACFVSLNENDEVIGYYTLTSASLHKNLIPKKYRNKIPGNYNAPVTLLGRLARDITQKGTDLGEQLLMDALYRSCKISKENIGSMAVVVDPINEYAVKFYSKFGFEMLPDSRKMFIPMNTISNLFKDS